MNSVYTSGMKFELEILDFLGLSTPDRSKQATVFPQQLEVKIAFFQLLLHFQGWPKVAKSTKVKIWLQRSFLLAFLSGSPDRHSAASPVERTEILEMEKRQFL